MFSRPSEVLYAQVTPANPSPQFGCTDCLLKNGVDAPQAPLYLQYGTYLCAEHVVQRQNAPIFNERTS